MVAARQEHARYSRKFWHPLQRTVDRGASRSMMVLRRMPSVQWRAKAVAEKQRGGYLIKKVGLPRSIHLGARAGALVFGTATLAAATSQVWNMPALMAAAPSLEVEEKTEIFKQVDVSVLSDLLRCIRLALAFAPIVVLLPFLSWTRDGRKRLASVLVWCMEAAGPTFVKLGQWASTRPDILPEDLCRELSRLHDGVTPELAHVAMQQLRTSLARKVELKNVPLEDIFEEISARPIGAGCISQVFRGRLTAEYGGAQVAIKIKRQGVDEMVRQDLRLLQLFVGLVEAAAPSLRWMSLSEGVQEFADMLHAQLDFSVEAKNLTRFCKHFPGDKGVRFPTPVLQVSSSEVLVEAFECGT